MDGCILLVVAQVASTDSGEDEGVVTVVEERWCCWMVYSLEFVG